MSFKIEVWGKYACFSRPEMKVERCSYDVITPSAARGLIESIYWHPGLKWVVEKIHVLSKIEFTNIRRNEIKSKILASNVNSAMKGNTDPLFISSSKDIVQRAATILQNVHYVIEARFELIPEAMSEQDNEGKFCDIFKRRLTKGQCYHQPYFGTREFPANFKIWDGGEILTAYSEEEKDLGFMLFDLDYSDANNIMPMFFRAKMNKGVIDLRDCEVYR